MALVARGSHALPHLREIVANPLLRAKAVSVLATLGERGVLAYAAAPTRSRETLRALYCEIAPELSLRAVWSVARGSAAALPQASWPALTELTGEIMAARAPELPARAWGHAALGLARLKTGDVAGAAEALASALNAGAGCSECGDAVGDAAIALGRMALARNRPDDLLAPLTALAALGEHDELARLLAAALLNLPDTGDLRTLVGLVISEFDASPPGNRGSAGGPGIAHLQAAWRIAAAGLAARASVRGGYFAEQLTRLDAATRRVAEMLGDPWTLEASDGQPLAVCNSAVSQLNELLSDLVAYQPLAVVEVSPRQIILEVAMARKEELDAAGIRLACSPPNAPDADAPLTLDPAMIKGMLRQVLRYLAKEVPSPELPRSGRGVGPKPAVTLVARASGGQLASDDRALPVVASLPAAVLTIAVSGFGEVAPQLLERALAVATVPDILRRTGGRAWVTTGGESPAIEVEFPGQLPAESAGACLVADEGAGDLPASLALAAAGGAGPDELAAMAVTGFLTLKRCELGAWGEDLAIVLHDLKNSIAFVSGWLRESDIYDQATVRARCIDNLSDVQFWLSQVGAMLSRSAERQRPWIDLNELTGRVMRGLAALMAHRRQRLVLHAGQDLPKVQAEPVWVASVLRNLAKNAIEAMAEGGELQVSLGRGRGAPGSVEITIRDQGPGFPELVLTSGDTVPRSGDGLHRPHVGLASVRRILAEHGGELELSNDGGGVARVRFDTGSGVPGLAEQVDRWDSLGPDTKRALVAARALAGSDRAAANHLWSRALAMAGETALAGIAWPALIPWAVQLVEGSSAKPSLGPAARRLLSAVSTAPGASVAPRVEAAARRLLGRVLDGRAKVPELSSLELGLLLALFGADSGLSSPPPLARFGDQTARRELARQLLAVAAAMDDPAGTPDAAEAAVLKALSGLVLLSHLSATD